MKYDKDTMNSLQEAYASVNEVKYYSGEDRNKKTGNPKKISNRKNIKPQDEGIKNQKQLDQMRKGLGAGSDLRDIPEEQEPEGMKYSDKKNIQRQKQLLDASKKAPVGKNKIVPLKTRTEEAIKMSRKQYTSEEKTVKHKKKVVPESVEKNCGCGQTPCKTYGNVNEKKKEMDDKMKEVEDMRSLPTRMNLIKTKLRAMGLNMSHQLKGKELSEVINYTLNELNRSERETGIDTKTGKPIVKGGTKKPTSPKTPDPALDKVTKSIYASGGKIMRSGSNQQKKVRGGPTGGGGKYLKMQQQKNQLKADANERGFSNIQNYVDTMAIYGGKKNYDQGRGSGS